VQPADAQCAEDIFEVEVFGCCLGDRCVGSVGAADGASDAEAALCEVDAVSADSATPPWQMKSSMSLPTSLSANAVMTAVFKPKHFLRPRTTLYSPPPSHALNERAVRILPSPGSSLSMISPRLTASNV